MSPTAWGGVLGATAALGILLVASRVAALRRPHLGLRVLPYLRDVPRIGQPVRPVASPAGASPFHAASEVFGPGVRAAADLVERVLGGSASVRRRLDRLGVEMTVHEFRVEQVFWGLGGFGLVAGVQVLRALSGPVSPVAALILCGVGFGTGVLLRDNRLSAQVTRRERQMVVEFPVVAELLALSVAAGESPVAALDRVVRRCRGELARELGGLLARIRTGESVGQAFDRLASTTGLELVARFSRGVAVAVERGTPLADVLHAQAADVREAGRRALIESAARREVAMMAPVVFLVLPVTIVFAFFPGAIGLRLMAP
ncbi:MAG: type II secretion system F family protein [Nocardioides sp.]|uniref:type II secretion system F family protein n=1 Tax=Nocardioides sp. TaxID=35761 RepID=UPI003F0B03C2